MKGWRPWRRKTQSWGHVLTSWKYQVREYGISWNTRDIYVGSCLWMYYGHEPQSGSDRKSSSHRGSYQSLGIEVTPVDISMAHKLLRGKGDKVCPIIVRFSSWCVRISIYYTRRKLCGQSSSSAVFVNENLKKNCRNLFRSSSLSKK